MNLTGSNLGGMLLAPGVYFFSGIADITDVLTLDGKTKSIPVLSFKLAPR